MVDVFAWRTRKREDIVYIDKGKLPFHFCQHDVHCSFKRPWRILHSKGHAHRTGKAMKGCKGGFIAISFCNFDLPYPIVAFNVENFVAQPSESINSSMPGIGYKSRTVTAFNLRYSTQKQSVPSFLETKPIGNAHSVGFKNVHSKRSIYFRLLEFSRLSTSTLWGWVKWSVIGLLELNLVLHGLNQHNMCFPWAFKLCDHVNKFIAIRRMLVCYGEDIATIRLQHFV